MLTTGTAVLIVMNIKFGPQLCVMGRAPKASGNVMNMAFLGDFTELSWVVLLVCCRIGAAHSAHVANPLRAKLLLSKERFVWAVA